MSSKNNPPVIVRNRRNRHQEARNFIKPHVKYKEGEPI